MRPPLGVIEGFFGRPYAPDERTDLMRAAAAAGYGFWIYAPKADAKLRRRWREPYHEAELTDLAAFGRACREAGVAFGVGLTPYEAHFDFDAAARDALSAKTRALREAGADWLGIFFDDMRGDVPDLAERQIRIVAHAAEAAGGARILTTPSYYSDDPVLDRVFGARPPGYLDALGRGLDAGVEVMWTGEEVCSLAWSAGHLARVGEVLRRRPFLWDNYPVNDGPRMSRRLHLRAFTGRGAEIAPLVAGHGVNPASQARLSLLPLLTLPMSYDRGPDYAYGAAFREAARAALGADLADALAADLLSLQDAGLDGLSDARRSALRARYAAFDHPAAAEVVDWLDGRWRVEVEEVQTQ